MASQKQNDDQTHPSSHTTNSSSSTPEKYEHLHQMHHENVHLKSQIGQLREKINLAINENSISVDSEFDEDVRDMVANSRDEVKRTFSEGSFQKLFWDEQENSPSLTENFAGHIPAKVGFSPEVDKQLVDMIDFTQEANTYTSLVIDEVHIKEDLVYDKHESSLIGLVNLGNISNHLLSFERSLADEPEQIPAIASSILVIMVRGLTSKLNFPYVQFACANLSGDLLVDPIWEAIS